jgi:hypothetical protein
VERHEGVAESRGQLLVQLRGRQCWYPVEAVTISRPRQCLFGRVISDLLDVARLNQGFFTISSGS